MESERFDALIRAVAAGPSRRRLLRTGIGAFTLAGLAFGGLALDETEAGKRRRRRRRRKKRKKRKQRERCRGNRPVTCGDGCCPENYPLCCDDARDASNSHTCNPASATCCPVEQGGGSCEGAFSVCCDATPQNPFGSCAMPGGACCPAELGGGTCRPDEPVCCPDEDPLFIGYCCPADSTCCQDDVDCASNDCVFGCCFPADALRAEAASGRTRRARSAQESGNRFHLPAR